MPVHPLAPNLHPCVHCLARFWWQKYGVFTKRQRKALSHISLSRIVCDNTGITTVPRDIFKAKIYPQGFVPCSRIPSLKLSAWRGT